MKYVPPFGFPDETPYVDTDLEEGVEGSPVPAAAIEHTQREVVNAIIKAGLTPDPNDLKQLGQAVSVMIDNGLEQLDQDISKRMEKARYEMCEFYYFRHPMLRKGFQPAQGGLLAGAATLYPEAWAYLQTTVGRKLCTSEAEWQSMTRAVWHTNADGTPIGWNGIGGAPFYAPDYATGALRLPDLRGMYAEAAGFDNLVVGSVHGDAIRNIWAYTYVIQYVRDPSAAIGALYLENIHSWSQYSNTVTGPAGEAGFSVGIDASRVVPTANKNQPRAWGALPCVYLGIPQ